MQILLVSATRAEIAGIIRQLETEPETIPHRVQLLHTGVGILQSVFQLQKEIYRQRPDIVIQAGIAGSFSKEYANGSVVCIEADRVADEGVWENKEWKSLGDMHFQDEDRFPFLEGWLWHPYLSCREKTGLPVVKGLTVNQISTNPEQIQAFQKKYNAITESMEGASLHYTCLMETIPFLQLRSISNPVGERNKQNWDFGAAIAALERELMKTLTNIQPDWLLPNTEK